MKQTILLALLTLIIVSCNVNPNKGERIEQLEIEADQTSKKIENFENKVKTLEKQNEQLESKVLDLQKQLISKDFN